jgi:predicted RecB family nuclease
MRALPALSTLPRRSSAFAEKMEHHYSTPLTLAAGVRHSFEANVSKHIAAAAEQVIDMQDQPPEDTLQQLASIRKPTILLQPAVNGVLGKWECSGRADAIRIESEPGKGLRIIVADIKASRQERVEHRIQAAIYARLVSQMAQENGIKLNAISAAILTMNEEGAFLPSTLRCLLLTLTRFIPSSIGSYPTLIAKLTKSFSFPLKRFLSSKL